MSDEKTPVPDLKAGGRKPLKERQERKRAEKLARRQETVIGDYTRERRPHFLVSLIRVIIVLVIFWFILSWVWNEHLGPFFDANRIEEEASRILTLNEIKNGLPDDTEWRYPSFTHNERLIIPTNGQLFKIGVFSKHTKLERSLVGPPYEWIDEDILNNVDEQRPKWLSNKMELRKTKAIRFSPETLKWFEMDTVTEFCIRRVK